MPGVGAWPAAVGRGFVRSTLLAAAAWIAPAAAVTLPLADAMGGSAWSWTNPWSWVGLVAAVAVLALVLARPLGILSRRAVGRWCGITIDDGYRQSVTEPVLLSTGYWWSGYSYERSRSDAVMDQRWRQRVGDPAYWRDVRWLAIAAVVVGPVCAVPGSALAGAWLTFRHPTATRVVIGTLLLVLAVTSAAYAWRIIGPLADRWLRPPPGRAAEERVLQLELQRADMSATHVAELRRIERDLHDGAQARLVGVGLSLAMAEKLMDRDPERAKALLREARHSASSSLSELRELVRGVNPPVLVERGLVAAIAALALDSPVPVQVDAPERLPLDAPVAAAIYFAVAELLANAAKHAQSAHVLVRIRADGSTVVVDVADDGPGGAIIEPGGGLDGIRRRLAVFDGTFTVRSPTGGPTEARIVVSCASS